VTGARAPPRVRWVIRWYGGVCSAGCARVEGVSVRKWDGVLRGRTVGTDGDGGWIEDSGSGTEPWVTQDLAANIVRAEGVYLGVGLCEVQDDLTIVSSLSCGGLCGDLDLHPGRRNFDEYFGVLEWEASWGLWGCGGRQYAI
jgi:hypothetical protein